MAEQLWRIDMARITSNLHVALVAEAASGGAASPVAAGAVLIEDRGQAIERMLPKVEAVVADVLDLEDPSSESLAQLGFTAQRIRIVAVYLLAAAEGRET